MKKISGARIRIILFAVLFLVFSIGYFLGQKRVEITRRATFVTLLSAIQSLRAGETTNALSRLENHCYSTTVSLLSAPCSEKDFAVRTLVPELVTYRRQFATNVTNWSVVEERLES